MTFREALVELAAAPLRRFRHLSGTDREAETIWAVRDVSFDVQPGEVVGIIGRNGAGKSTLLKILTRITEPTVGRAEVRGRVGSLLEVGTGFHQELTGRENVFLNGAILGMRHAAIKRQFDRIVDFSGVEKFLDTPVKHYSSGMAVRLAFAVAAHLDPEVLLIDEVLAVGDAEFQKKCAGKMHDVATQGRTVLFVSHNMIAVRQLCSRAVLLEGGTVVADGPSEAVITRYIEGVGSETCSLARYAADAAKKLQILQIAVKDASGKLLPSPFELNNEMRAEITYEVRQRVNEPFFACYFRNSEGTVVLFLDSRDSVTPLEYGLGTHRVAITLPAGIFNVGHYVLFVGVRQGEEQLEAVGGDVAVDLHDLKTGRPAPRPGFSAWKLPWRSLPFDREPVACERPINPKP
jgi:lipopolysaccharide transport system ATP-binding protein